MWVAFNLCHYYNCLSIPMCPVYKGGKLHTGLWGQVCFDSLIIKVLTRLHYLISIYYNLNTMTPAFLCDSFTGQNQSNLQISGAGGLLNRRISDVIMFMFTIIFPLVWARQANRTQPFMKYLPIWFTFRAGWMYLWERQNRMPLKHPSSLCNLFFPLSWILYKDRL